MECYGLGVVRMVKKLCSKGDVEGEKVGDRWLLTIFLASGVDLFEIWGGLML